MSVNNPINHDADRRSYQAIETTDGRGDGATPHPTHQPGFWRSMRASRFCIYAYTGVCAVIVFLSLISAYRGGRRGGVGPSAAPAAAEGEHSLTPPPPKIPTRQTDKVYDYIIVGGGPAGIVMARKLSDDPTKKVMLIEAGGPSQASLGGTAYAAPPLTMFDIPLFWSSVAHLSDYHWDIPGAMIAKALGGCGIHNAMLYVRALEKDFEIWNVAGWTWKRVLRYYKSFESFVGPPSDWHGYDGPITTSYPPYVDEVSPLFLTACSRVGLGQTTDFNEPGRRHGCGLYNFNINNGLRHSAARALLAPIIERKNLDIVVHAEVKHVLMRHHGGELEAIGVEYAHEGKLKRVQHVSATYVNGNSTTHPKGAVILTAGAINTPKILMASGLGDAKQLTKAGLPVRKDIPGVGKNLMDHPGIGLVYELKPGVLRVVGGPTNYIEQLNMYRDWVDSGANPVPPKRATGDDVVDKENAGPPLFLQFAGAGLAAGAFIESGIGKNPLPEYPDLQLTLFPRVTEPHLLTRQGNITSDRFMLVTIALLDPDARYRLELDPDDPINGNPILQEIKGPNGEFLSNDDLEKLMYGVNMVRVVARTSPLVDTIESERLPGITDQQALKEWLKTNRYPNSHWCGTAKMGNSNDTDPMIVVDERLRVKGVKGLRVADASVIPKIPNGNVHSTVLTIAAYGADMLIEDTQSELERR